MNYGQEIINVLSEADRKGLSLKKIARHVYNMSNGLFNELTYDDVYRDVVSFIKRNSRDAVSMIEKTDVRGVYRINSTVVQSAQLMLDFHDEEKEDQISHTIDEDTSLNLFE